MLSVIQGPLDRQQPHGGMAGGGGEPLTAFGLCSQSFNLDGLSRCRFLARSRPSGNPSTTGHVDAKTRARGLALLQWPATARPAVETGN